MGLYTCSTCGKEFRRKSSRDIHFRLRHREPRQIPTSPRQSHQCPFCNTASGNESSFSTRNDLALHVDSVHLNSLNFSLHKSALNGKIKFFRKLIFSEQTLQAFAVDKKNRTDIADVIIHELSKSQIIKVSLILSAAYQIPALINDGDTTSSQELLIADRDTFALRTESVNFSAHESKRVLMNKIKRLLTALVTREEDLLMRGSGWRFDSLSFCDVQITNLAPIYLN